jgi:hypothetical protein
MADQFKGKVIKDAAQPLMMRSLYNVGGSQFVFPEPAVKGFISYVTKIDYKAKTHEDALVLNLQAEGQNKEVTLLGTKGSIGEPQVVKIGKLEYTFLILT